MGKLQPTDDKKQLLPKIIAWKNARTTLKTLGDEQTDMACLGSLKLLLSKYNSISGDEGVIQFMKNK